MYAIRSYYDGRGELFERTRVHARAWLVLAGLQDIDGQGLQFTLVFVVLVGRQQGVESAAEAFEFGRSHSVVVPAVQSVLTRSIISLAKSR